MSQLEITKVLTQMRALASQLEAPAAPTALPGTGQGPQFSEVLNRALDSVNGQQQPCQSSTRCARR